MSSLGSGEFHFFLQSSASHACCSMQMGRVKALERLFLPRSISSTLSWRLVARQQARERVQYHNIQLAVFIIYLLEYAWRESPWRLLSSSCISCVSLCELDANNTRAVNEQHVNGFNLWSWCSWARFDLLSAFPRRTECDTPKHGNGTFPALSAAQDYKQLMFWVHWSTNSEMSIITLQISIELSTSLLNKHLT